MVIVFEGTDHAYYMDSTLKANLDTARDVIKRDFDMIFFIDGGEGTGKSVLAQQLAFYCDQTLEVSRIVFNPDEFKTSIRKAGKYQAIIYDEAYSGLNSRASMSAVNRALVSMLTEIRQKNLFIFIVAPSFFDIDRYVAIHRSRALIHTYLGDNFERGYFAFYNADAKKYLYINGKKYYEYKSQRPNFIGRFTKPYMVPEQDYRRKKAQSGTLRAEAAESAEIEAAAQALLERRIFALGDQVPLALRKKLLGLAHTTFYRHRKIYEAEQTGESAEMNDLWDESTE